MARAPQVQPKIYLGPDISATQLHLSSCTRLLLAHSLLVVACYLRSSQPFLPSAGACRPLPLVPKSSTSPLDDNKSDKNNTLSAIHLSSSQQQQAQTTTTNSPKRFGCPQEAPAGPAIFRAVSRLVLCIGARHFSARASHMSRAQLDSICRVVVVAAAASQTCVCRTGAGKPVGVRAHHQRPGCAPTALAS